MTTEPLTLTDAIALGEIVALAQSCARVRWLDDDNEIRAGTARHLCRQPGSAAYLAAGQDVRDGALRVTTDHGLERWFAVRELMEMLTGRTFVRD